MNKIRNQSSLRFENGTFVQIDTEPEDRSMVPAVGPHFHDVLNSNDLSLQHEHPHRTADQSGQTV